MPGRDLLSGILVIDKPSGPTSFDVVRRVRTLLKVKKAGHTGTLDPIATGVLPICIGDSTKLASYVTEGEKEYECTVRFGESTDTQDSAGKTLETKPVDGLTSEKIEAALGAFRGEIDQLTPMYSARKVDGKRLYELAREGKEVERKTSKITIDEARLDSFALPDAKIFIRSSKGAYMRTLAHDLGAALGTGAHLKSLRRVRTGPFTLEGAIALDVLMKLAQEGRRDEIERHLFPPHVALSELAELRLDERMVRQVLHGRALNPSDLVRLKAPPLPRGRRVRIAGPEGEVLAVGESDGMGTVKLLRVLAHGGADDADAGDA